jgi:hypothetical protein
MSCLFDSLSHFVDNMNSQQMRHLIVNYLSTNPTLMDGILFNQILEWDQQNSQDYLLNMNNNNTWGGAIEIKAFVNLFKINVHVHIPMVRRMVEFLYNEDSTNPIIHILWTGNHFIPLQINNIKITYNNNNTNS